MVSIQETQIRRLVDGVAALNAGDNALGTVLLREAVALCGRRTPRGLEFDARSNFGEALRRDGLWTEAEEQLVIAERLAALIHDREGLAKTQVRRAQIALNYGIPDGTRAATRDRAARAAATLLTLGVFGPATLGYFIAAKIAAQDGDRDIALRWFDRAVTAAREDDHGVATLLAEIATSQDQAGDLAAARETVSVGFAKARDDDFGPQLALYRASYRVNTNLGLPVSVWPVEWDENHPGAAGLSKHELCHLHQELTFAEQARRRPRAAMRHAGRALALYDDDSNQDECLVGFQGRTMGMGSGRRISMVIGLLVRDGSQRDDPSHRSTTFDNRRIQFAYGLAVVGFLRAAERRLRLGLPTFDPTAANFAHLVLGEVLERLARRQIRREAREPLLREAFELTTIARLAREATRYTLPERALRIAHDGKRSMSGRFQQFRIAASLRDGALLAACVASGYQGSLQLGDRGDHHAVSPAPEAPDASPLSTPLVAGTTLHLLGGREYLHAFEGPMVRMPDGSLALAPFIRGAVLAYGLTFGELRSPFAVELA